MDKLHFPVREVPPYGEYASAATLLVGHTYFRVHFLDQQMTIPELVPLVYIGRNLIEGDTDSLYFQDFESYSAGIPFGDESGGTHTVDADTPYVYDFEHALDRLLYCSLTRHRQR
jgi:hypothetical protein